jgi:hypothetical protein
MNTQQIVEHEPISSPVKIINADAGSLMAVISRAIADPEFNVDKLERLLTVTLPVYERLKAAEAKSAFDTAVGNAKAEIPVISKNRKVDFTGKTGIRTNYVHEDLAEIVRVITPVLGKHGLSFRFRTTSIPNEPIMVTCVLSGHGHTEENTLIGPRDDSGNKNALQSIGSTVTYLQRYTLKAALGLAASNDDDGQQAGGTINDAQLAELRALIVETNTPIAKVCEFARVEKLEDIPVTSFDLVMFGTRQRAKRADAKAAETA